MKYTIFAIILLFFGIDCLAQSLWPTSHPQSKPYTRWWWHGSAVDKKGISHNLSEFAQAGIGGVEITPIYGVTGNDSCNIPFLSPQWMELLRHVETEGERLGIETNLSTGTGWPFGGPFVSKEDAARKAIFVTDKRGRVSLTIGNTGQKVKRASPGEEGYVIDHFSWAAVANYLSRFDQAFTESGVPAPANFFNDSYEVFGADWTPSLVDEFRERRGYDITRHLSSFVKPDSLRNNTDRRILSDYRETLGELLYENFTIQWTEWAHKHGSLTRNQSHGSPANLLDLYAAVDIPECEGFGLSDFGILGLRTDPGYTRLNDSDLSMLKYASSGAHLSGHNLVSSETFTWLTEHFRTSLSQCKPELDLFFVSGVNHVYFHGSCYSPQCEEWPGWRFYASVDMSPYNNWWTSMPAFSKYIERCQSFLQWGQPDNDILVYLPYHDMLYEQPGTIALFDIHSMKQRAPKFIQAVHSIISLGYDVDYISDRYIQSIDLTSSNWKAIIIPDVRFMPIKTLHRLNELAEKGYDVIFVKNLPASAPGYAGKRLQKEFSSVINRLRTHAKLAHDYETALTSTNARPEPMRAQEGLSCIRRTNETGHHYFISNLQGRDIDADINLGVHCQDALFYNPMNGIVTKAQIKTNGQVSLQLRSGESILLRTFDKKADYERLLSIHKNIHPQKYYNKDSARPLPLHQWTLTFKEAAPTPIDQTFTLYEPTDWTTLGDSLLSATMATGVYKTTIRLDSSTIMQDHPYATGATAFVLDLGDVRETAHVFVNNKDVGVLFSVPYRIDITPYLVAGENTLVIEVANLPANRIAQMDRNAIPWRHFNDINVVNIAYENRSYSDWSPVPSGLCSPVRLIRYTLK